VEGKFSSSKYVSSVQSVKRELPKPGHHLFIAKGKQLAVARQRSEKRDDRTHRSG
jgi:hypothetical protein